MFRSTRFFNFVYFRYILLVAEGNSTWEPEANAVTINTDMILRLLSDILFSTDTNV